MDYEETIKGDAIGAVKGVSVCRPGNVKASSVYRPHRAYRAFILTDELNEDGTIKKTHVNQTSDEMPEPDQNNEEMRRLTLCKRCVDALGRGRYLVRRVDVGQLTRVRSCDLCHSRTLCGLYDVSVNRRPPVKHVNWRTRLKEEEQGQTEQGQIE